MTKLGRDIVVNVLFAAINVGSLWLLTRLSTGTFAPAALALFMLVRRYSASFVCIICLGGPTFQIRYTAMHADDKALGQLVTLLMVAVYVVVAALVIATLSVGAGAFQQALFPGASYPLWVLWYVALLSMQQLFHFVVIDNLLVARRMIPYNIYRLLTSSGIYIGALFLVSDGSVRRVLWLSLVAGAILFAAGLGAYAVDAARNVRHLPFRRTWWLLRELFVYGPPRSMINLADSLLFVVGPWLIRDHVDEVGYVLTMFVFVQATSIVVLPINELSMVLGANRVGRGNTEDLESGTRELFATMLVFSSILVVAIFPYREALFRLFIARTDTLVGVSRYSLLLSCIVPLTVYSGLKGVIEMRWKAPRNLANLVASLTCGVALFYWLRRMGNDGPNAVLWASMMTFWVLGSMTVLSAWSLLRKVAWRPLATVCGLSVAVLVANMWALRLVNPASVPIFLQLLLAAVNASVLLVLWWYAAKPLLLQVALGAVRRWFSRDALIGSS